MVDDVDGEISVRGSPALTAEFFYVMRGMMLVSDCQRRLEHATTAEERLHEARAGGGALRSVRDSFERIPELINVLEHSPEACAMFTQTLGAQRELYEAARARFKATLDGYGLSDEPA